MLLTIKVLWRCTGARMLSILPINEISCCCPDYVQMGLRTDRGFSEVLDSLRCAKLLQREVSIC